MIWLSPMAGTEEGSVYFEIRDIALQSTGCGTDGLVRGLLGDGQCEVWAEVQLGKNSQASIIPLWADDGQVETLSAAIDEDLLKRQLLEAVAKVFNPVTWSSVRQNLEPSDIKKVNFQDHWLAA